MTFGQFLAILRARWRVAALVFALLVVGAVVVTLLLPKQYSATASVVVDVKPDPVSATGYSNNAASGFLATQVDILKSDRVVLRVIRDLKLLESPQIRQQWQDAAKGRGTLEQWLTATLQNGLEVKPSRESNVINVIYQSADPRFAAGLANAFAQAYIATTLELRVDPARQFTTFFNAQVKDARDNLERAQARHSAFQRENGIIASDERLDIETARLNDLSSQVTQMESVSAESSSRQAQAQGAQGDRLQEVLNNSLISGLKGDLARSEVRLQELSQRLGDAHPQVQETKANVAELRARVDAEVKRVTGGVGVTNTINRGRQSQTQRELQSQRAKVLRTKAVRDESMVLQREVENAQRLYDSLTARMNQTAMEAQSTQSYVNVLTVAQPPVSPSSPRLWVNTAVATAVGLLAALAVILLMELADRRVRSPEDVVDALNLPVLGVMPRPDAKRFQAGYRPLLGASAGALPAPAAHVKPV